MKPSYKALIKRPAFLSKKKRYILSSTHLQPQPQPKAQTVSQTQTKTVPPPLPQSQTQDQAQTILKPQQLLSIPKPSSTFSKVQHFIIVISKLFSSDEDDNVPLVFKRQRKTYTAPSSDAPALDVIPL